MPELKNFHKMFEEVMKEKEHLNLKKDALDNVSWAVCAAAIVRYYKNYNEPTKGVKASAIVAEKKELQIKKETPIEEVEEVANIGTSKEIIPGRSYSHGDKIPMHHDLESVL